MKNASLRVLHVLEELKPSGAETMLLAAAPEFYKHGVKGEILSTGNEVGPFAPRLGECGYVIHHIPFAKSATFFLRVFRLMRSGFDVIHLHTERGNFWFALVALLAARGRVVRTIHSSFSFSGFLRWRRMVQRRILQRLGVCHVAISESVRRVEGDRFGTKPVVVFNWYNSLHFISPSTEAREASRRALAIAGDALVIVSVGNCAQVKNHTALLEALALLPAEKRPLYLHVGHEEVGEPERHLALHLGIAGYVRFIGPLTDVRPALYAADAFVMPSLREGLPIAAIEALACGLPAIFTEVQGLIYFRQIYPGLIYCDTTAEKIAHCIAGLFEMSRASRYHLSEKYAELSRKHFGMERGVAGYLQLYHGR